MGICGPTHDKRSWTFDLDPGGVDPVLGIPRIQDAYFKRDPEYPRGITVPAIVDVPTGAVVTNDFPQITLDLETQWRELPPRRRARPLPRGPRATRSRRSASRSTAEVNNGVYRCGFAGTQDAYDEAYDRLWEHLDLARGAPGDAALPRRRPHHRGRRAPVHDARALRRRLPRPLQVQPQQAHRDAGAVGLRARPVPDARLRRHGRLRRTSSGTTTSCTPTSTPPASCRSAPPSRTGRRRTVVSRWAARRSVTARLRDPRARSSLPSTIPCWHSWSADTLDRVCRRVALSLKGTRRHRLVRNGRTPRGQERARRPARGGSPRAARQRSRPAGHRRAPAPSRAARAWRCRCCRR